MKCTIGNCCGVNIMHTNEKIRCYPLRRHLTPKQGLIFYSLTLFKEISIPVVGYLYQCRQLVNRYVARSYNRYSSCLWGAFHSVVQKLRFDNAQFCVYSRLDKSPFETILLLYDICYDIICCSYRHHTFLNLKTPRSRKKKPAGVGVFKTARFFPLKNLLYHRISM